MIAGWRNSSASSGDSNDSALVWVTGLGAGNLPRVGRMAAHLLSIGGAGTFDDELLSGVAAVLIASL
jgi:uncharacterized membrane protein